MPKPSHFQIVPEPTPQEKELGEKDTIQRCAVCSHMAHDRPWCKDHRFHMLPHEVERGTCKGWQISPRLEMLLENLQHDSRIITATTSPRIGRLIP